MGRNSTAARPRHSTASRPRHSTAGRVRRGIGLAIAAGSVWVGVSLGSALAAPGSDSPAARTAEWARDHHLGVLVGTAEKLQYRLHQPRVGGKPDAGTLSQLTEGPSASPTAAPTVSGPRSRGAARAVVPPPVAVHAPLHPMVTPALPGEGTFHVEVVAHGLPVLQAAYLRPDSARSSYVDGVAWIDHRAAAWQLHPGYEDPGGLGRWDQPDLVPPAARAKLLATFNGGFKTNESRGGFYENGHTAGALLPGAASLVVYRDGHMDLGSWGTEVAMTPQVAAVRQNLRLMIDGGRVAGDLDSDVRSNWGLTLGGGYAVWRSGVGVTAEGDTVVVMGDALTARALGELLLDAGAVRAMEMDINPEWMSFMWYTPSGNPLRPTAHKLVDFRRPADRYFGPTSRDFFSLSLR